jgi:undecaprenyl diphosphate synthase
MNNPHRIQNLDGLHVAIIMDGNGRWANRQGKPRFIGHQAGAARVPEIVETAPELNISVLTLYAFSSDNWQRPKYEINFLMNLFESYLQSEIEKCIENGIKLSIIGRRDRLSPKITSLIEQAELLTTNGMNLLLRVAIDYSARDAIIRVAQKIEPKHTITREKFSHLLSSENSIGTIIPDVDLLIRTGGEQRLSDFLLWECAYAELYFTKIMWPDFTGYNLKEAIEKFQVRERRFGQIPQTAVI